MTRFAAVNLSPVNFSAPAKDHKRLEVKVAFPAHSEAQDLGTEAHILQCDAKGYALGTWCSLQQESCPLGTLTTYLRNTKMSESMD